MQARRELIENRAETSFQDVDSFEETLQRFGGVL